MTGALRLGRLAAASLWLVLPTAAVAAQAEADTRLFGPSGQFVESPGARGLLRIACLVLGDGVLAAYDETGALLSRFRRAPCER